MKVNEFIRNSRLLFNQLVHNKQQLNIVLGNQSADLDSIVSSIAMSFFMNRENNKLLKKTSSSDHDFIPIININRNVLNKKRECVYLFNELAVDMNDLICLSELHQDANLIDKVALVDHNELDENETRLDLANHVHALVDHHLDKGDFAHVSPRIVETAVGSNTTLVLELLRAQTPSANGLDESFARMMLFPILADTSNLRKHVSDRDKDSVAYLKSLCDLTVDTNSIFAKIVECKQPNDDDLNDVNALLSNDYKQYVQNTKRWGISSTRVYLRRWLVDSNASRKSSIEQDITQFMAERDLHALVILSSYKEMNDKQESSKLRKELLIVLGNEKLLRRMEQFNYSNLEIVNTTWKRGHLYFTLYNQLDVSKTRKFWHPTLEKDLMSVDF